LNSEIYVQDREIEHEEKQPNWMSSGEFMCLFNENLTFRGLCIMIYSYNKSQRDVLFLKFILVKNSTCFRQIYCPSSGVLILYTQQ